MRSVSTCGKRVFVILFVASLIVGSGSALAAGRTRPSKPTPPPESIIKRLIRAVFDDGLGIPKP